MNFLHMKKSFDENSRVEKELLKEKFQVEKLTIDCLSAKGKLNVRGALEYCRAKILGPKEVRFRFQEPFDKALEELENNEDFIKILKEKCGKSKVREKDVVKCIGGLYHNASKEFHEHDFDAVEIVTKSWTENEIIALASIFTHCEVRYIVLDEYGQPSNIAEKNRKITGIRKKKREEGTKQEKEDFAKQKQGETIIFKGKMNELNNVNFELHSSVTVSKEQGDALKEFKELKMVMKQAGLFAKYIDKVSVTSHVREQYMTNYGRTDLPTEELGMDAILKENFLLQNAMQDPLKYIEQRNHLLKQIKKETDDEYVRTYKQYTTGEYKLPPKQADLLSKKALYTTMVGRLEHIEALFPSKFENRAFNLILKRLGAEKKIDSQTSE
eukprot:gene3053-5224_t